MASRASRLDGVSAPVTDGDKPTSSQSAHQGGNGPSGPPGKPGKQYQFNVVCGGNPADGSQFVVAQFTVRPPGGIVPAGVSGFRQDPDLDRLAKRLTVLAAPIIAREVGITRVDEHGTSGRELVRAATVSIFAVAETIGRPELTANQLDDVTRAELERKLAELGATLRRTYNELKAALELIADPLAIDAAAAELKVQAPPPPGTLPRRTVQ